VDAYGESEQVTAFYTMIENDLQLPFETEFVGATVIIERIDTRLFSRASRTHSENVKGPER